MALERPYYVDAPVVIQICSPSFFISTSKRKQRLPFLAPFVVRCATTLCHTFSERNVYTCFVPVTVWLTVPAPPQNFAPPESLPVEHSQRTHLHRLSEVSALNDTHLHETQMNLTFSCA